MPWSLCSQDLKTLLLGRTLANLILVMEYNANKRPYYFNHTL